MRSIALLLLIISSLSGCAGHFQRAEKHAASDEWAQAVLEYRQAYAKNPGDIQYKSRLRQAELRAADFFYQRGQRFAEQANFDAAIIEFQQGLNAMPEHSKLIQGMNNVVARKEASKLYVEARTLFDAGKAAEARSRLEQVLELDPDHPPALAALKTLRQQEQERGADTLALKSRAPITLNFRQTDLRTAFEFIGKSFGINVVFDEGIKAMPVTLFVQNVTFDQALKLMLATTRTFYREVGANTVLIVPDSKEKRAQYEDQMVQVFYLNTIRAKDMADLVRTTFAPKKLSVSEANNSLVIRDTPEVLRLTAQLIETSDVRSAELLLEVEILEINRNKAERLGLDFGSEIGVKFPNFPVSDSWRNAIRAGTVALPAATLRYFKQDVDAKTLANPKVRVMNNKTAKIHIGDRVPLRAATLVDALGQTRTSYEYRDVGIKLNVEPTIHLDNSATVKLSLEVSTLGQNLGTVQEPAFSIGTRNAETSMVLRDGETVILGGLIRDEERSNQVRLPGLGDIPLAGKLFTSFDNTGGRTDVLLTITSRVVRGWELPGKNARTFFAGTDNALSDRPALAALGVAGGEGQVVSDAAPPGGSAPAPSTTNPAASATAPPLPAEPAPQAAPVIAFAQGTYDVVSGQEIDLALVGTGLGPATEVYFGMGFNPSLLHFVRVAPGNAPAESIGVNGSPASTSVSLTLLYAPGAPPPDGATLAHVVLAAQKPGIVYLVQSSPTVVLADGTRVAGQSRATRINIR